MDCYCADILAICLQAASRTRHSVLEDLRSTALDLARGQANNCITRAHNKHTGRSTGALSGRRAQCRGLRWSSSMSIELIIESTCVRLYRLQTKPEELALERVDRLNDSSCGIFTCSGLIGIIKMAKERSRDIGIETQTHTQTQPGPGKGTEN